MLEAAPVGPSQDLSSQLQSLCTTSTGLVVYQSLSSYGGRYEIIRLLNLVDPKVVFLEAGVLSEALRIAKEIRAANSQTRIVGFARECDSEQTAALKEAGVGSILLYPFTAPKIRQAVAEALESGIPRSRGWHLKVVLNRSTVMGVTGRDIQRILGRRELVSLPNDYTRVCKAGLTGKRLAGSSKIARSFVGFAEKVVEEKAVGVARAAERVSTETLVGAVRAFDLELARLFINFTGRDCASHENTISQLSSRWRAASVISINLVLF